MGFVAEIDSKAEEAAKASEGDGTYAPLPAGKYQVTIAKVKGVESFAKQGVNANKRVVNIGFQIVPESPTGKGRYLWDRVPLFSRFGPSDKHPDGAPAKAYFDFWEKFIGLDRETVLSGQLPDNIGGRRGTITISAPIPPDEYNPLGSNEVSFYDKEGDVAVTPVRTPGVSVAPWLDENDNLRPEFGQAATAATVASTPTVDPYAAAAAATQATQAPAAAPVNDPWAPSAADVAYSQQTQ